MSAKPLDALMSKEMSRGEFLATLALGLGSVMGMSTVIHLLTGHSLSHQGIRRSVSTGYGNSSYGGGTEAKLTAKAKV